jgi:hypothetical protein
MAISWEGILTVYVFAFSVLDAMGAYLNMSMAVAIAGFSDA